jgi:hypothetical protein
MSNRNRSSQSTRFLKKDADLNSRARLTLEIMTMAVAYSEIMFQLKDKPSPSLSKEGRFSKLLCNPGRTSNPNPGYLSAVIMEMETARETGIIMEEVADGNTIKQTNI